MKARILGTYQEKELEVGDKVLFEVKTDTGNTVIKSRGFFKGILDDPIAPSYIIDDEYYLIYQTTIIGIIPKDKTQRITE